MTERGAPMSMTRPRYISSRIQVWQVYIGAVKYRGGYSDTYDMLNASFENSAIWDGYVFLNPDHTNFLRNACEFRAFDLELYELHRFRAEAMIHVAA